QIQRYKLSIRIADEAQQAPALADAVGVPLRFDALLLQRLERGREVVDRERDVPVAGAEVVRAAIVVVGELELLVLAGDAEEVVRRLLLAVPDDVHIAAELEAERLVEGAALLRVGDAVHGVEVASHAAEASAGPRAGSRTARRPAIRRASDTPCASRPRARI